MAMIEITPATQLDLHRLTELESEIFVSDRISCRQFKYLLTKANSIVVKAEKAKVVLGYMVLLMRKKSRKLRVYSIGVVDSARRYGIAGSLLMYAEKEAMNRHKSRLTLEVCEHNHPALKLYAENGFSVYGRKEDYYENGCTALLLQKEITMKETNR